MLETGHIGTPGEPDDQYRDGQPSQLAPVQLAQDDIVDRSDQKHIDNQKGQNVQRGGQPAPGNRIGGLVSRVSIPDCKPADSSALRAYGPIPQVLQIIPLTERVEPGVKRLDEVRAARQLDLAWKPEA